MAVSELNLKERTWLVPAGRMKGDLPHLVPLPPRALELIEEALKLAGKESAFVFPSPRDPKKPIRPDAVTHRMADLCLVLGIVDASPHDLRRTTSTILTSERLSVSPFIRSKLLAHAGATGGGAAVSSVHYDANEYVAEKRRGLEAWENLLLEIVGEQDRSYNVSKFEQSSINGSLPKLGTV